MLIFKPEISIGDVANLMVFLVAAVALFYTKRQIELSTKAQRAQFLKELYLNIYANKEIQEAFYSIEYNRFRYDQNFHGSDEERKIDNLLSHVDLISGLFNADVVVG